MLGLVLGLGVGAGAYVGGLLPQRPPRPIPISVATLPTTFLGYERDDLANNPNAVKLRDVAEASRAEYAASYGGPGISMTYGAVKSMGIQVWVQNGLVGSLVQTSDAQALRVQALIGATEIPGTATTRCLVTGFDTIQLPAGATAADVAKARASVATSRGGGTVVCTRRDVGRNVTINATLTYTLGGASRAEDSRRVAEAVDALFATVVK